MDKRYRIVVNYDTGDSFNQEPDQELEVWDNNDKHLAEENCRRIREHQRFYSELEEWGRLYAWNKSKPRPEPHMPYIKLGEYGFYTCDLLDDDGEAHTVSCYDWQGYFETFNYVEIQEKRFRLC